MYKVAESCCLVTGGAGFIGSHLVEILLTMNCNVIVLDDLTIGSKNNLDLSNPGLEFVEGSILDMDVMEPLFRKADYVFHLATQNVRLSLKRPTIVHEVNSTGALNVLKLAAEHKIKKFLYCSSSEVNGTAVEVPMKELYHYRPETIYGASKLVGEYYSTVFHKSGWVPVCIVRPHNNYGPREHYEGIFGEVVPRFIIQAYNDKEITVYGDGAQTRDFTFVRDTADLIVKIMESDKSDGEIYNVCTNIEISIRELGEQIFRLLGKESRINSLPGRPNDVLRLLGDNSKLKNDLNLQPQTNIEVGLKETVNWFLDNLDMKQALKEVEKESYWQDIEPELWLRNADVGN